MKSNGFPTAAFIYQALTTISRGVKKRSHHGRRIGEFASLDLLWKARRGGHASYHGNQRLRQRANAAVTTCIPSHSRVGRIGIETLMIGGGGTDSRAARGKSIAAPRLVVRVVGDYDDCGM
jgi:hypothetical protein